MNKTLFVHNIKTSYKILLIFIIILGLYSGVIVYMFDPELAGLLEQYKTLMPELMAAVGMTGNTDTLVGFINTYFNGFLLMIMPVVYVLIITHKYIVKYIENGSMAGILATPNSRREIIVTQMFSQICGLITLLFFNTILIIVFSEIFFPGELDIIKLVILVISMFFIHLELCAVIFLAACFAPDGKFYYLVGAGIPILFYLIHALSEISTKLDWMKNLTIFSLFEGEKIINGYLPVFTWMVLALTSGILYFTGILYFRKRDLCV